MPIYRGPGGSGDAVNDASSEATLVAQLVVEAQEDADAAQASATAAAGSASAASSSASAASTSASNAATSATNASNSASTATTQATNAANSATAAQTAETAAELAETNAETAQAAAASSASAAATSATNSANSASAASTSATNASNSASSASTSATNASNSATAAATSASNASTSATAAAASAVTAAGYVVPSQTGNNGKYLKTDGTATSWDALDISTADITGTLPLANGGTGGTTAATARTSLGLAIGTNVQAWDADLDTWATKTAPSGTVVGTSDTQTLTNKTIALGSNTVSGTLAQFNTAVTDADLVSLAGTETLTNKTLTSPTLTTPALGTPASGVVTNLTGTASININGTVGATTPAAGTFTSITDSGNLTFTGTGNRITGDFSNATEASKVFVQTSTVNGNTAFGLLPNGTSSVSFFEALSGTDPANTSRARLMSFSTEMSLRATISGTGTYVPMTFHTGGSERLRIDTSGNVGIGLTAPLDKLSISTSTAGGVGGVISAANGATATVGNESVLAFRNASQFGTTYYSGKIRSVMTNATTFLSDLAFNTYDASGANGVEVMRLTSAGNVGIGNASPSNRLSVSATTSTPVSIQTSNADNFLTLGNLTNNALIGAVGSNLTFTVASSERIRITSAGNVGIGTSSPQAKAVVSNSGAAGLEFFVNYPGGGLGTYIQSYSRSGSAYIDTAYDALTHSFRTSGTESMRITSAGNVGIGTNSPTSSGAGYPRVLDLSGTYPAYVLTSTTASKKYSIGVNSSPALVFYDETANAERMRIDTSGNVGIGTSSPTVKLQISGGVAVQGAGFPSAGAGIELSYNSGTALSSLQSYARTGSAWKDLEINALTQRFGTNSAERMRIDSSGNVGIGTSSPSGRLDVVNTTTPYLNITATAASTAAVLCINATSGGEEAITYQRALRFGTATGVNAAGFTERMRIDANGRVLVGKTSTSDTTLGFEVRTTGSAYSTGTDNFWVAYSTTGAAYRFYVSNAGTINATNTTITGISDERVKENIIDLDDGLNAVMALKPRKFDWKAGKGRGIKGDRGFIAQEFETVFPDMIEEWLDPAPEGEEPYKAVNANLIPTLVKAIQEQQAMIEQLTTRLNALEGK